MATKGRPCQLELGVMRRQELAPEVNRELVEALADLLLEAAGGDVAVQEGSDESEDLV